MQTGALNALELKVALAATLVGFKKATKDFGYKRLKKQDRSGLIAAKPRDYSLIGCTILLSHQPGVRVLFTLNSCQHLLLSVTLGVSLSHCSNLLPLI